MDLKDVIGLSIGGVGLVATIILGYLAVFRAPRIAAALANKASEDERRRQAASVATCLLQDLASIHLPLRDYLARPTKEQLTVFTKTTVSYLLALEDITLFSPDTVQHLLDVRRMYGKLIGHANDGRTPVLPLQLQIVAAIAERVLRVLPDTVAALEREGGLRPPADNFTGLPIRSAYSLPPSAFPELDEGTVASLLTETRRPISGIVVTPEPATSDGNSSDTPHGESNS